MCQHVGTMLAQRSSLHRSIRIDEIDPRHVNFVTIGGDTTIAAKGNFIIVIMCPLLHPAPPGHALVPALALEMSRRNVCATSFDQCPCSRCVATNVFATSWKWCGRGRGVQQTLCSQRRARNVLEVVVFEGVACIDPNPEIIAVHPQSFLRPGGRHADPGARWSPLRAMLRSPAAVGLAALAPH